LVPKHRFFLHLRGGNDPDAERVYRWHIEARKISNAALGFGMDGKVDTDHYVRMAGGLFVSMSLRGFLPQGAVPIDPNGELLGGAHRVACALALGINEIAVERHTALCWPPPWGEAWFLDNGMAAEDMERLRRDYAALTSNVVSSHR
jgi:hypothetical protein